MKLSSRQQTQTLPEPETHKEKMTIIPSTDSNSIGGMHRADGNTQGPIGKGVYYYLELLKNFQSRVKKSLFFYAQNIIIGLRMVFDTLSI